jgi:hypothetical protein
LAVFLLQGRRLSMAFHQAGKSNNISVIARRAAMSKYEYVEKGSGRGWMMEVRKGASHKGNVRKNPITGRFQFFKGPRNAIRTTLEEPDLATLVAGIEKLDF